MFEQKKMGLFTYKFYVKNIAQVDAVWNRSIYIKWVMKKSKRKKSKENRTVALRPFSLHSLFNPLMSHRNAKCNKINIFLCTIITYESLLSSMFVIFRIF